MTNLNKCSLNHFRMHWYLLIPLVMYLFFMATSVNAEDSFVKESVAKNSVVNDALSAEQWLKKMHRASIDESYRGTFMFSRGGVSSSMSITHRFHDGEEQELLKQLDGEMGEVVRRGSQVMCVFPDNRVIQLEQSKYTDKLVQTLADFMPDHRNYHLEVIEVCRLIERPCVKLAIQAQDQHRYSYFLWLDEVTGLLLKSSLKNAEGADLESFQYTHIEFPEFIRDEELVPMNSGVLVEHVLIPMVKKDVSWPNEMGWVSTWVPPGYKKVSSDASSGDELSGENVMLYSDGLASYSIFVEKIKSNMMPEGASQVGATVAYAKILQYDSFPYAVTVIGEIPPMTAMLVAESIKPKM